MTQRTVKDKEGRVWTCSTSTAPQNGAKVGPVGRDVKLVCSTPSLPASITVTVGWGWEKMSENGLARLIVSAAA
jgi:hypothetical protein